jgi:hypothetical protein
MENSSDRKKYLLFTFTFCMLFIGFTFFCEKSNLYYGIGSDGEYFNEATPELLIWFLNRIYPSEALTRVFPIIIAFLLYTPLNYFHPEPHLSFQIHNEEFILHQNVILTFEILNIIYLCASVLIFAYIFYKKNIKFKIFFLCSTLFIVIHAKYTFEWATSLCLYPINVSAWH